MLLQTVVLKVTGNNRQKGRTREELWPDQVKEDGQHCRLCWLIQKAEEVLFISVQSSLRPGIIDFVS
jgi:hypothetical protein